MEDKKMTRFRTLTMAAMAAATTLVGASAADAALLAGFYDAGTDAVVVGLAANTRETGITATFDGRGRGGAGNFWGSNDTTHGTTLGGAAPAGDSETDTAIYRVSANFSGGVFTITNNTGFDVSLETLAFDYHNNDEVGRDYWDNLALTYESGDLAVADGTLINSVTGLSRHNSVDGIAMQGGDYADFDWSLAGLADHTLADGESATFKILATFTDTAANNARNFAGVDNVGFIGTVGIPEPASLALIGLGGLLIARRRRA
jgi:hypothetical protein